MYKYFSAIYRQKYNLHFQPFIDLFVGGFLERPDRSSILGPVFTCILTDTFARLKVGDRFFYDYNHDENTKFTLEQLDEIRKASMARIVCDNAEEINEIQPQIFKKSGFSKLNDLVSCDNTDRIPQLDLSKFLSEDDEEESESVTESGSGFGIESDFNNDDYVE